ncbi:MAG: hypothetical protein ACQEP1_00390 [Nanobdellota archaeon]
MGAELIGPKEYDVNKNMSRFLEDYTINNFSMDPDIGFGLKGGYKDSEDKNMIKVYDLSDMKSITKNKNSKAAELRGISFRQNTGKNENKKYSCFDVDIGDLLLRIFMENNGVSDEIFREPNPQTIDLGYSLDSIFKEDKGIRVNVYESLPYNAETRWFKYKLENDYGIKLGTRVLE